VRSWLRAADLLGEGVGATPLARIEDPECRFQVLVLPDIVVMGPEDVTRLEAHLDRGGSLLVDGRLAWVDRSGRPWKESVLDRLRQRAPDRVRVVPEGLFDLRAGESPAESRRRLRSFLNPVLADPGLPFALEGDSTQRAWIIREDWTTRKSVTKDPQILVTLLPNASTAVERASLSGLVPNVSSPHRIEWVHPTPGENLPPGDAAVFVLHYSPARREKY
jgi:hypothetical protein